MKYFGAKAAVFTKHNKLRSNEMENENKDEEQMQTDFDLKYFNGPDSGEDEISIRRIPVLFWSFGLLLIICGSYLLYSIIIGPSSTKKLFNGLDKGAWWEYLVIILIIILGFSFLISAKFEKIEVIKKTSLLTVFKNNLLCSKQKFSIPLKNIKSIYIIKKESKAGSNISIQYRIGIKYDEKIVSCMTSLWKRKVMMEVSKLRNFIFKNHDLNYLSDKDRDNVI